MRTNNQLLFDIYCRKKKIGSPYYKKYQYYKFFEQKNFIQNEINIRLSIYKQIYEKGMKSLHRDDYEYCKRYYYESIIPNGFVFTYDQVTFKRSDEQAIKRIKERSLNGNNDMVFYGEKTIAMEFGNSYSLNSNAAVRKDEVFNMIEVEKSTEDINKAYNGSLVEGINREVRGRRPLEFTQVEISPDDGSAPDVEIVEDYAEIVKDNESYKYPLPPLPSVYPTSLLDRIKQKLQYKVIHEDFLTQAVSDLLKLSEGDEEYEEVLGIIERIIDHENKNKKKKWFGF